MDLWEIMLDFSPATLEDLVFGRETRS